MFVYIGLLWDEDFKEDETKPVWNSNWTWRDMPAKADQKIEGVYSFLASQPSYSWTWPSSEKRKMQSLSRVDAFRRVIDYLTVHVTPALRRSFSLSKDGNCRPPSRLLRILGQDVYIIDRGLVPRY